MAECTALLADRYLQAFLDVGPEFKVRFSKLRMANPICSNEISENGGIRKKLSAYRFSGTLIANEVIIIPANRNFNLYYKSNTADQIGKFKMPDRHSYFHKFLGIS